MANKLHYKGDVIDLSRYVTQSVYASKTGYKLGTISQWIKRHKAGQSIPHSIDIKEIPELGVTLIKL